MRIKMVDSEEGGKVPLAVNDNGRPYLWSPGGPLFPEPSAPAKKPKRERSLER